MLFLVMGSSGEYSDRMEWPVALYKTQGEARYVAEMAKKHANEQRAIQQAWYSGPEGKYSHLYSYVMTARHNLRSGNLPAVAVAAAEKRVAAYPEINEDTPQPCRPEEALNPFDPTMGGGDEYWVKEVEIKSIEEFAIRNLPLVASE